MKKKTAVIAVPEVCPDASPAPGTAAVTGAGPGQDGYYLLIAAILEVHLLTAPDKNLCLGGDFMKKTYWCVVSTFSSGGRVGTRVCSREAEAKPQNRSRSTAKADIYEDWFDTLEAAEAYRAGVKAA
jgi:hypothetical protein